MSHPRKRLSRRLVCEVLETRCVLSSLTGDDGHFNPVIVAGAAPDSPGARVDVNSASSPFAGVGSLQINTRRGAYICTATPIDATHVLTAGHCIDINNDGRSDKKDGIQSVYFQLNLDVDAGTDQVDARIKAASWQPNPDFTGFNRPSINDDLAIVTLSTPLAGAPTYALPTTDMTAGVTRLVMVGYGQSGDGVNGYTAGASWTVKRKGENMADAFYTQDDAGKPAASEVFRFDFDGPTGNGTFGGATLGNDIETTLGGGDSGGPSFVLADPSHPDSAGSYVLVGVNTFTQGLNAPKFGSLGGGINIYPYLDWIQSVLAGSTLAGDGGSGGGPGGNGAPGKAYLAVLAGMPATSFHLPLTVLANGNLPTEERPDDAALPTTGSTNVVVSLPQDVATSRLIRVTQDASTSSAEDEEANHEELFANVDWLLAPM